MSDQLNTQAPETKTPEDLRVAAVAAVSVALRVGSAWCLPVERTPFQSKTAHQRAVAWAP